MGYKCLIVDDDPLVTDLVRHFCDKCQAFEFCIASSNAKDGLRLLSHDSFDCIFLDFNLPDMKGRDFLEMMPSPTPVIMITSESEFAVSSYDYNQVIDYMIKPLQYDRFLKSIHKLNNSHPSKNVEPIPSGEAIFIKDGNKLVRLHLDQIHYIKSDGNYVSFVSDISRSMASMTMSELESKLPKNFIRVHRSYFINFNYLKQIIQDKILIGEFEIPIGEKYKQDLIAMIQQF